ncbi:hypothetical protein [Paracoccus sp. PAR01]|jgi:hypothetical protein|uniref:hypothetical protein n=1 Tax=Paracoccus sp. PAR01 TaxID=2769282 RepID=UPI00177FB2C9|nr:hypothetical protein [Paracoccus sp. PAR01]MBD9525641.1 hypothetical protein [Paracoccus sp. PAR01]
MFASATNRQPQGFADRLLTLIGLRERDKPTLCVSETDRFAALDDPATRKALSVLPPHLLRDIGVNTPDDGHHGQPVEGDALRKYLW